MYSSNTIFVGNIQSIKDEQLREYFQRFGKIEGFYHNCTCAADEWLIDYRFIRFSSDTNMSVFLTNKIDHMICRIRLDIYPYDAAFRDETRLILDRKICIAHTDSKLDRNVIKKAFTKYGRILNCTCTSSGNGVEYVYIEFESINSVRSVFASGQRHFAGKTPLAVKQPLRPSQVEVKTECISINEKEPSVSRCSHRQRINSNVDTAQYSSFLINRHNSIIEEELRTSTPNQSSNSLSQSLLFFAF
jgi:RNA recognition motif-containing protein